ncbi:putative short chain dehydrogenase [Coniochaeta sp. 2T2.1]|nr:putative short chain dehydrogenase [Coniochaeta sp. 2T2.1]
MDAKKVVLVTGGNTGLGYEIVRALCASDVAYEVLLGGRSLVKAEHAIRSLSKEFPTSCTHLRPIQVDLEDDTSINSAFQFVSNSYGKLDALVNNGGCQLDRGYEEDGMTARQMWNRTYDVNVTGTHIMTATFAPLLVKSTDPRLVFITSGISSLEGSQDSSKPWNQVPIKSWAQYLKPPSPDVPAYRCSKTAVNMLMRFVDALMSYRFLKEDGVKAWCISPGYLATGLGGSRERNLQHGAIEPAIGGQFVRDVLEGKRDDNVGKVILREMVQPW